MSARTQKLTASNPNHRRAFSLVELVVVIGIIVLIISIVLPALAGARNAAKVEASRSLVNQFTNAVASFKQDKSRLPGFFSVRDMGDTQNATIGLSTMQNAMLDLAGGITAQPANQADKIYAVSPTGANSVNVSLDLIGAGGKSYFPVLGKNFYKKQDGSEGGERISSDDIKQIPEVVDAWGQPILLWVADTTVAGPIQSISDNNNNALVRAASTAAAGTPPARFYWNSNAAFLKTLGASNPPYVGTQRKQQNAQSWISEDHPNHIKNLSVLLGSPTGPVGITRPYDQILPSTQRGDYIVQSAGKNFIYMGMNENTKGFAANNTLFYGAGFKDPSGGSRTDSNGKPTSVDIMAQSDDIWQSGN